MSAVRNAIAAATCAASAVGLGGCGTEGDTSASVSQMTVMLGGNYLSLDPALTVDYESRVIQQFVYDRLVAKDPESGKTVSNLASSWSFTPTSAHFVIKDGVVCGDGSAFTAKTVVRNLERLKDPKTQSPLTASILGGYDYTVALGEGGSSVEVTFPQPVPFLAERFATGPNMICDAGLDRPDSLAKTPVGTGPYTVSAADPASGTAELELRDDDYNWGIGGASVTDEMPKAIKFRPVSDPDAMANLVNSGDGDVAQISGSARKRVEDAGDTSGLLAATSSHLLYFNHREGFPTADKEVRKALSQVLSPEEYTNVAAPETGYVSTSLTPPNVICSADGKVNDDIVSGAGSDAAAETLTTAGWTKNSGGIWEKDGKQLTIRLLNAGAPQAATEYLRSSWAALGVDVKVDSRGDTEAFTVAFAGKEWDVTVMPYGTSTPQPALFSAATPPEGSNLSAIRNTQYDADVKQATAADGDCAKWIDAEAALFQQADVLPLMNDDMKLVSRTWNLGSPDVFFPIPTALKPL